MIRLVARLYRSLDAYFHQPMITIQIQPNPLAVELERIRARLIDIETRLNGNIVDR